MPLAQALVAAGGVKDIRLELGACGLIAGVGHGESGEGACSIIAFQVFSKNDLPIKKIKGKKSIGKRNCKTEIGIFLNHLVFSHRDF